MVVRSRTRITRGATQIASAGLAPCAPSSAFRRRVWGGAAASDTHTAVATGARMVYCCSNQLNGGKVPVARTLTPEMIELVAERFRALAEPARLHLMQALRAGEQTVGDLVEST
ncbi:MAG: ArsR/SmtB family transcription factor, partial [Gemmatirosa sp.]